MTQPGKKTTPHKYNSNKKQSLSRPKTKNVDPFPRIAGRPSYPVRKAGPYRPQRHSRRSRRARRWRTKKFLFRKIRRNPRNKFRRFKARPWTAWTVIKRKARSLSYFARRRNRYWRKISAVVRYRRVKVMSAHRQLFLAPSLHAHTVRRTYRLSTRALAKRVIARAFRKTVKRGRQTVLPDEKFTAKREARQRRLRRYRSKLRGTAFPTKAKAVRCAFQLRLQRAQLKSNTRPLDIKAVRKAIYSRDRRKRQKRRRISKRGGSPKRLQLRSVARQLVRKLRAVPRTATRALRQRLLRHKRKYYRKSRTRFRAIRYLRRLRVKRRTTRRIRRYTRSTLTVLRGARARILHRRAIARKRRALYLQVSQRGRLLLLNPVTTGAKQAGRQQLFIGKEQRRRLRALRLITGRALTSVHKAATQNWIRARHATTKLRRRLAGYTSALAPRLPRVRSELTPQLFTITPTWLLLRQQRVQARRLHSPYLTAELSHLKQYRTVHKALAPALRQLPQIAANKSPFLAQLSGVSVPAKLALFRTPTTREILFTKSTVQSSRSAVRTIRSERTRLLEARYYRTRAKLRLPNQKVRRAERKRQGLRLFARHTLKRPTTISGREKLLLPPITRCTVTSGHLLTTSALADKDISVPERMLAYHPRVHFRGPRRYELGLILSSRMRKSVKKIQRRHRRHRAKAVLKKKRVRELAVIKPKKQVDFEKFITVIQKAQTMDSATLAQKFFKKLTFASAVQQDAAKAIFLSRLQAACLKLSALKRVPTKAARRAHPTASVERPALKATRLTNSKRRELGLWHLRSVQGMLNRERDFSAWSPQYGTNFRRWGSPRRYGRPMQPRKLSRLARKLRRIINNALASRNRPKRKYFDRSFGRIQYYRGSAASLGYSRYRRVYRPRSKNNRWWKPLKHGVPFTHPYSRRSLNVKKGLQVSLARAFGHRPGRAARVGRVAARWLEPEEKPRHILSSTYQFRRKKWETWRMFQLRVKMERARMPFTLQNWLPIRLGASGKVEARTRTSTVLARTRRSIRKLERTFPRSNAWAIRRWEGLDYNNSTTSATALFAAAVNQLSSSFWTRLRAALGTQSKRAALQKALFIRFRSWRTSTLAAPVVGGPDYSQNLALAVKFITTSVGELLHGVIDSNFHSDLDSGAFIRRLTSKQQRSWKLRYLGKARKSIKVRPAPLYSKNTHALRRRWLYGAERYLKRNRVGRLPPRQRRGGDRRLTNYGRSRRRFPASGRRKQSYDSMLHAFAKRISPSRFRRAAVTRFRRIYPKIVRDSKINHRNYELTRRRRLQRKAAFTLSRVAYLSPAWRELLTFRENSPVAFPTTDYATSAAEALLAPQKSSVKSLTPYSAQYGQPFSTPAKRRFASLPVNVMFKRAQLARRLLRSSTALSLRAHRIGLLRTALRRRRMERVFVDLKKHTSRRRLAKERLAPSWKRRKLTRKREKYLRYGDWTPRHFWLKPAKNISWTLHSLEERAPRRQDRALDASLRSPSGELLLLTPKTAKRRNWAGGGFKIKLTSPRVKTRRSRQVIRRRRRRSRRIGLGGWVKFHHWIERKQYNRILTRARRRRGFAARIAGRQGYRSRVGLLFHKKVRAGMMFSRSKVKVTKVNLPLGLTLRANTLPRFSSLTRHRGLKRLQRRAAHRRSKFLRRRVAALRRQQRPATRVNSGVAEARLFVSRALRPFTENLVPRTVLAPLTFVRRTRRVIKTEAEKLRAIVWNIKNKEIRYKKTAQYTESLTRFIPELMSYMISRHTAHKKLTYSYVKGLISATYWNLRIYLNVDPFAGRLALRDRNFKQLRFLNKSIVKLSREQVTEHADRTRLRWRFQPCRLQPAPTSDRFRLDWLRAFFPRKHALYQEDPEYYSRAILSSRNIRRVPLTGYGIGRARTYRSTISVERRARHLLRMRLSRREPRLETVLQTTRRIPETELEQFVPTLVPDSEEVVLEKERALAQRVAEEDAAIFARSKKFVFVKKARAPKLSAVEITAAGIDHLFDEHIAARNPQPKYRTSFFQRAYSTTASRALISTAKLIALQGRLSAIDGEQTTAFSELSARARVRARLVARGRTNFIASTDFMVNAGGLDPRFLRYKSPRSRQYGIRKPASISAKRLTAPQFTELARLHQKREPLWSRRETKQALRLRRRHFYIDTPTTAGTRVAHVLTTARLTTPFRRVPTALHSRTVIANQQVLQTQFRNFPNHKQLIFTPQVDHIKRSLLRKEGRFFEMRPLLKGQLLQHWRSRIGTSGIVNGERAALLYRTPAQRSTSVSCRADRVLTYRAIKARRGIIARSRSGKRAFRAFGRVQHRYKRNLQGLQFAWAVGNDTSKLRLNQTARALSDLQQAMRRTVAFRPARRTARFTRKGVTLSYSKGALSHKFSANKSVSGVRVKYFQTAALRRIARRARFTRRCIIRQRVDYQTPFDTFRPKLWYMLTHRWMKKHRILKEWLKEVDLWFKDPWLSLLVDPSRRGKRVPGEIRAREQQDGEVVTGKENAGYTGAEKAARVKAAHRAIAGAYAVVKKDIEHTKRHLERASTAKKAKILSRIEISRQVLRKPRPSMWLANLQCKRWVAEKAAWIAKPKAEKKAHLLERKKLSIARVKRGKRPLGPKAVPLKVPADHFIPRVIWKDIHRRVRRLTWRESDDAFTRRGFRNAFKFYPTERNRAPWLEALMYNRSLYSTNLREFRRRQFPREQKKYKWLQRVRKALFPGRTHTYIKGRRWPRIRMYNQRLHYSLFNLPDRNSARRHFKKLRGRSRTIGFVHAQEGLSNRLDNVLIHLNMAPTIFWARHVATRGLLRVNGKIAYGADYRLKAGDFIEPVWDKVIKYRHFFKNPLHRREEKLRHNRWSLTGVSRNFEYHPAIRCYTFLGNPREEELRESSRLQPHLFRWFCLDSGAKKSVT